MPIEDLRVGHRVASTFVTNIPENSAPFDPREWHLVKLRLSNPADPGDTYEMETLRPLAWVVEHGAFPGNTITFASERNPEDQGYVVALERMPEIADGPGRVVLTTYTHRDQILRFRFEGQAQSVDATPSHRIHSADADTWVPAAELKVGEHVRTRDGKVRIAAIERTVVARVFDIEVESDHSYFIDGADVLAHNCPVSIKAQTKHRGKNRTVLDSNNRTWHLPDGTTDDKIPDVDVDGDNFQTTATQLATSFVESTDLSTNQLSAIARAEAIAQVDPKQGWKVTRLKAQYKSSWIHEQLLQQYGHPGKHGVDVERASPNHSWEFLRDSKKNRDVHAKRMSKVFYRLILFK